MGRPTLPGAQRRTINFTIRLTGEELESLNRMAALSGKTAGELIRQKIFTGHFPRPRMARIERDAFLELKKIGTNINQQTRLANAGKLPPGLMPLLNQLKEHEEFIISQLMHDRQSENWKELYGRSKL
jgi:hypothetical protein